MKYPVLLMARELEAGGSERQLTGTALALDRSRFEPYVGTFRPTGSPVQELQSAGVPIVHFPVYSFRSFAAVRGAWALARFIRSRNIRLVHAFDAPMAVFATPVVRHFTRAIMLTSQRGHRNLTPEYRSLLRWTDRRVQGIVVNCEYMRRHLIEDEQVPEPMIRLCHNGVCLSRFTAAQDGERPASLPTGALVVGVVSGLRPEKGLGLLIDAFASIHAQTPGIRLVFVGSGTELNSLQMHARRAGVFEQSVWQPATPEVAKWLRHIDIFVLPSLSEAFSNVIMEAMACGCAVIASDAGGNPELIRHLANGMLFPSGNTAALADALATLIQDEPLRRRLAASGQQFIRENFSLEFAARRMGEIYESFLASRLT